ncbi:hypothetical protein [Parablautia muri]|uniref:Uncharacterized protein n=1 Tax=Parablautia muri TaxID=2320879 RepID=A0A9X5BF47_9FIRM|nr:hypothetical protein [Parablautia muri]NBJ92488.1 hypothetical protein [Parablautia muri]
MMQVGSNIKDGAKEAKYFDGRAFRSNGAGEQENDAIEGTGMDGGETVDFMEMLKGKKEEIIKKVVNGETEPKIQIGAQAFTEKEWDRLLKQFDSAEDAIKEKMREEYAKRFKKQTGQTKESDPDEEKKGPLSDSDTDIEELLRQIL